MSDRQGRNPYQEKKSARTYNLLTFLIALMVLVTGALHYKTDAMQKYLTDTATAAQAQSMLTQRIALLILQYQTAASDDGSLEDLRNTASAALVNNNTLETAFLAVLPPLLEDNTSTQESLSTLSDFVSKSMAYASAPQEKGSKESGQALISKSRDAAASWDALTSAFITVSQKKIDFMTHISLGLYFLILDLLAFQFLFLFRPAMASITEQRGKLDRLATTDQLSGAYNRTTLFKNAHSLIGVYKRQQQPLTVLAIDIDNLGKVNDTYGRTAGDALIRQVSTALREILRASDILGRIDGGEFCVFLPSLDESRATAIAEKLRLGIEKRPFELKETSVYASISIGVAEMKEHHGGPDGMLISAEEALRRAKQISSTSHLGAVSV